MLSWKSFNSLLPAKYIHSNLGPGNHIDRGLPAVRQIHGNAGFSKHPFSWIILFLSGGTKPFRTKLICICLLTTEPSCHYSARSYAVPLLSTALCWLLILAPKSLPSFCAEPYKGVSWRSWPWSYYTTLGLMDNINLMSLTQTTLELWN